MRGIFAACVALSMICGTARADRLPWPQVSVLEDELDPIVTFAAIPPPLTDRQLLRMQAYDNEYLRAFLDKRTGKVAYQVYVSVIYSAPWRHYVAGDFETANGPDERELVTIAKDVGYCGRVTDCQLQEDVALTVEEGTLRWVASRSDDDFPVWNLKVKAHDGSDLRFKIGRSEVVRLLAAVDAYRAAHRDPSRP